MVINIASFGGRTHMLDLARELERFGHTVRFYSYVYDKRAIQFGLKKECNYSILWFAFPFLILRKIFGNKIWVQHLYNVSCDCFLSYYMKPCDIFIGQSPMHLRATKVAKEKFGAITILERGISHVKFQTKVLHSIHKNIKIPSYHFNRDLRGYNIPDYISVGSEHVKQTFIDNGFPEKQIFVNNYGSNTMFFSPTELTMSKPFDLIIVGQWCKRKGCQLITEAVKQTGLSLLHVGSIVDMDFPQDHNFHHVNSVPESKLIEYYKQARIFLMPSYDEGLALVQVQALTCGLPLVCSKYSGGRDLRKALTNPEYIIEMETMDIKSLVSCINKALEISSKQKGLRDILKSSDILSFQEYGKRYNSFLLSCKNNSTNR